MIKQYDMPVPTELRGDLSPIIQRTKYWAVTTYGMECLTSYYPIEANRLWESDWIDHMKGKDWVDMMDFRKCLKAAQVIHADAEPKEGDENYGF